MRTASRRFYALAAAMLMALSMFVAADPLYAQKLPFDFAENLAPKVADSVVANGEVVVFNLGNPDQGTKYEVMFYSGYDIFKASVRVYGNGNRTLAIDHYWTNRDFSKIQSPADFLAEDLLWGRAGIIAETHLTDDGADGSVSIFQQFTRPNGSSLLPFTREERDRGKKADVREYLVMNGKVLKQSGWFRKGRWAQASKDDLVTVRTNYEGWLYKIAKQFGVI